MKILHISFDGCHMSKVVLTKLAERCLPEIERIRSRGEGYGSVYASINLPIDMPMILRVKQLAKSIRAKNPSMLVIIGIGGSSLGIKALQEALLGVDDTAQDCLEVCYVDTVDSDMVMRVKKKAESALKKNRTVIVNIITKSGTTTETIANGAIFVDLLERYYNNNYKDYLYVTTNYESKLWRLAQSYRWNILDIPEKAGGRYSVLSAVGLFPLAIMGVDIDNLCAGAASIIESCTSLDLGVNIAVQSASTLYALYKAGYVIHNFFPFSYDLHAIGMWYRQLVAESLGKEYDQKVHKVHIGITPLVSIGSIDLHSIIELHLGGPDNTATTFMNVVRNHTDLHVPENGPLNDLVGNIHGKSLEVLMSAMLQGAQNAYTYKKKHYMTVSVPEKNAFYVGQLLQWKMLEIMYRGYLFGVNPFVQQQVELYKKETRDILERL